MGVGCWAAWAYMAGMSALVVGLLRRVGNSSSEALAAVEKQMQAIANTAASPDELPPELLADIAAQLHSSQQIDNQRQYHTPTQ